MKDFGNVTQPPEFVEAVRQGKLHFLLVNVNGKYIDDANQVLQLCVSNDLVEFDTTRTESVRALDGSAILDV